MNTFNADPIDPQAEHFRDTATAYDRQEILALTEGCDYDWFTELFLPSPANYVAQHLDSVGYVRNYQPFSYFAPKPQPALEPCADADHEAYLDHRADYPAMRCHACERAFVTGRDCSLHTSK